MLRNKNILLSVIIVSYNTKDLTLQTLESVVKDVEDSKTLFGSSEIIVVDNQSKDGSPQALIRFVAKTKKQTKNQVPIFLLRNRSNKGFGAANNQGIEKASGKFLLFLNPDTIVQQGALEKLVMSFFENKDSLDEAVISHSHNQLDRLGIVAATLINEDGTLQPQGGDFPNLISLFCQMSLLDDLPIIGRFLPSIQHTGRRAIEHLTPNSQSTPTSQSRDLILKNWVAATAMMVKREVIDEVGNFDENIFMYAEDVELCMRTRHHLWDVALHPSARVIHLQHQSGSQFNSRKGEFDGLLYIWSKHKPLWQIPLAKLILQFGALLRVVLFATIARDTDKLKTYRKIFRSLLT